VRVGEAGQRCLLCTPAAGRGAAGGGGAGAVRAGRQTPGKMARRGGTIQTADDGFNSATRCEKHGQTHARDPEMH